MEIKDQIVGRFTVIYVGISLMAVLLLTRVVVLMSAERRELKQKGDQQAYKEVTIEARRGDILARKGEILASSVPRYEIRMDPLSVQDDSLFLQKIDTLGMALAGLFYPEYDSVRLGHQIARGLVKARENGNRYYFLQRNVSYAELQQLKTFPIFERGRFGGGFIAKQKTKRVKPYRKLASRTIGRLKNPGETHNAVGIEGAYDEYLKGRDGFKLMRNLGGNRMMPVEGSKAVDPVHGKDLVSTIDITFQDVAENALEKRLKKHNAHHGSAILMKVKTGEILAMANLADTTGNGEYKEYYNYAIGERTEPGSTFKLASMIAALEDGYVDLFDTVDTGNGVTHYYGFPIRDTRRGGWGKLSVKEVMQVSSNVGVSKIIYNHYRNQPKRFLNRLYSMNIAKPSGIKLKGEPRPYVKFPDDDLWSGISLPQMSIGYEVMLTPLQVLNFYNAVANNGKMVRPRLGKHIEKQGKIIKKFETEVLNPAICTQKTIEEVHKMLEAVVQEGTATNLRNSHYKIAGKTGTAQLAYDSEGYMNDKNENRYQASFAGYFPADNPEYSCIAVINSPSNSVYYGSAVAAPVIEEIADKVYARSIELQTHAKKAEVNGSLKIPYSKCGNKNDLKFVLKHLNIPFQQKDRIESEYIHTIKRDKFVELNTRPVKDNFVPNVMGMGAMDALLLVKKSGLDVHIQGRGMVIKQSIKPGEPVKPGDKIYLLMSKTDG